MNQEQIEQYKQLHKQKKYGTSSEKLFPKLLLHVLRLGPSSILDYGCGQSTLVDRFGELGIETYKYDPAIEGIDILPNVKVDLVLCNDVLEHLDAKDINESIINIKNLSDNAIFSIGTNEAIFNLPNGKNCHITVKSIDWWIDYLKSKFKIIKIFEVYNYGFLCKTW